MKAECHVSRRFNFKRYNLLHWSNSGMNYWAVSDLNGVELHEFARLVQEAQ